MPAKATERERTLTEEGGALLSEEHSGSTQKWVHFVRANTFFLHTVRVDQEVAVEHPRLVPVVLLEAFVLSIELGADVVVLCVLPTRLSRGIVLLDVLALSLRLLGLHLCLIPLQA